MGRGGAGQGGAPGPRLLYADCRGCTVLLQGAGRRKAALGPLGAGSVPSAVQPLAGPSERVYGEVERGEGEGRRRGRWCNAKFTVRVWVAKS